MRLCWEANFSADMSTPSPLPLHRLLSSQDGKDRNALHKLALAGGAQLAQDLLELFGGNITDDARGNLDEVRMCLCVFLRACMSVCVCPSLHSCPRHHTCVCLLDETGSSGSGYPRSHPSKLCRSAFRVRLDGPSLATTPRGDCWDVCGHGRALRLGPRPSYAPTHTPEGGRRE